MEPESNEKGRIQHPAAENRRPTPLRRLVAGGVAGVFAAAAVVTGIISLGAYCVTTDGGNLRALSAFMATEDGSEAPSSGSPAGASCVLPPPASNDDTSHLTARFSALPASHGGPVVPPIDAQAHPHLETATFALG